jgi:hypothetical protein
MIFKRRYSCSWIAQVQLEERRPFSVSVGHTQCLAYLGALSAYESDSQFGSLMSMIHELLVHAKSDEKVRTLVSLLQALCRSDAGGDVVTASSSGTGSPGATRTNGFASHAIRHRSRFGGYIKGLETKVQGCVEQGDEDETREGGLAVHSSLV